MEATFLELLAKVRKEAEDLKNTDNAKAFDTQLEKMKASGNSAAMMAEFKSLREKNLSMDVLGKLVAEFKSVQTLLQAAYAHKQSLLASAPPAAGGRRHKKKTRRSKKSRSTRKRVRSA
jgi:hypothetical protein